MIQKFQEYSESLNEAVSPDKFRRLYNNKPFANYRSETKDSMGNKHILNVYLCYRETSDQDEIYFRPQLTGVASGMQHAISNMQCKWEFMGSDEAVGWSDEAAFNKDIIDNIGDERKLEKAIEGIAKDWLQSTIPQLIKDWVNTGVERIVSGPTFKIIRQ